jgi:hypothetical protein
MRALAAAALGSAVLAGLLAPGAAALPGDEPIALVSPADGATIAPSGDGSRFLFTCPVYRSADFGDGFATFGARSDYAARLATSPELGGDGRLRQDRLVDLGGVQSDNTVPPEQCLTVMGDEQRSGLAPGTYFWQVSRICTQCAGSYETSEVRRIVVRADVRAALAPSASLFGGYPAVFGIEASGAPDGTAVALERQAGRAWKRLARGTTSDGAAELIATVPAGRQRLRVVGSVGGQRFESPPTTIPVRRAGDRRATSAASDGGWTGTQRKPVRFRVADGGRLLRDFRANVTMVCPTVPAPGSVGGQVTTQAGVAAFARARIAPDGSFLGVAAREGTAVLVRGRLRGRALSDGVARVSVGACSGTLTFGARRG